jgi:putative transposase
VRPAVPLICQFIDEHKERFGVVPVCRALSVHGIQIAPRTYWARRASGPSKRALWDMTLTEILAGIYEPDNDGRRPPESMYGTVKMWGHLQRQGIEAAKCTIERLKRAHGWRGVTRARRPPRTTVADPAATRAPDLVRRQFRASRPGELVVADFTYVPMGTSRFGYTAFVIDAFAGFIRRSNTTFGMVRVGDWLCGARSASSARTKDGSTACPKPRRTADIALAARAFGWPRLRAPRCPAAHAVSQVSSARVRLDRRGDS